MPPFAPGTRPGALTQPGASQAAILGDTTLNPMAVGATQSAHSATAAIQLRFAAIVTALQASAIASVQVTERFIASLSAQQAIATASAAAALAFRAAASVTQSSPTAAATLTNDYATSVTATQAPHTAAVVLSNPSVVMPAVNGAPFVFFRPYVEPEQPRSVVTMWATQSPATCRAQCGTRSSARVLAIQAPHRATGSIEADPFTQEEQLMAWLMAA